MLTQRQFVYFDPTQRGAVPISKSGSTNDSLGNQRICKSGSCEIEEAGSRLPRDRNEIAPALVQCWQWSEFPFSFLLFASLFSLRFHLFFLHFAHHLFAFPKLLHNPLLAHIFICVISLAIDHTILPTMKLNFGAALVLLSSPVLVAAQTYTNCDPLKKCKLSTSISA